MKNNSSVLERPVKTESDVLRKEQLPVNKTAVKSSAIAALALFLTLNVVLSVSDPIAFDKFKYPYTSWSWWTIKDIQSLPQETNNVALLGSSLTVAPINSADATYFNESLDQTEYHRVRYLDQALEKKLGGKFRTFNLSCPGQMPSDAYLTLQAMVNLSEKPAVVLYGIAPRDFIDSNLAGPQDTDSFRYLSRIVSVANDENVIYAKPLDKINRTLEKNIYFYKNSMDLQMAFGSMVTDLMNTAAPEPASQKPFTYWDRVKLLPEYKKGEFHKYAHMAAPEDLSKPSEFIDNQIEYVYRYKKPKQEQFDMQMHFLNKLARYTKEEGIKLVLINMPLTKDNLALLKKEHYDNYINTMRSFSDNNNIHLLDFNNDNHFVKADFRDTVHMNARGGIKFLELVASKLTELDDLKVLLSGSGYKNSLAKEVRK